MPPLFSRFPLGIQAAYSELKQRAFDQESLLIGTPGTVSERTQDGRLYYFRQFYDAEGAKGAEHIGPRDHAASASKAAAIRGRIAQANDLLKSSQLLARGGYARTDARTDAVLVALANAGLFRAGAVVIGSHAYGALLNDLGIRAAAIVTEDIDVARGERLAVEGASFADLLAGSRVPLSPIPSLDRKGPSTSFFIPPILKRGRLRVDLVAPVAGTDVKVVRVPELDAHATGLPYLRYLLADPLETIILGRSSIIPVKAPRPERLAWHKMLVSELRAATSDKSKKDLEQASVLIAALTEDSPETLLEACASLPRPIHSKAKRAASKVEARLAAGGHTNAVVLLHDAVAKLS